MLKRCKVNEEKKLYYPTSEVKIWEELRIYYDKYGYEWVNLDVCKNISKIKKIDIKNQNKFIDLKLNESSLRSSLRGNVKIPFITPPPKPNNYDRYLLLKKWAKNKNCFDITMAAIDLFKNFNLEPCKDYDPGDILSVYYEEKRKELKTISNTSSSNSVNSSFSVSSFHRETAPSRQPATAPFSSNITKSSENHRLYPNEQDFVFFKNIQEVIEF